MSELRHKIFIYAEPSTHRVIWFKRSQDFDFTMNSDEFLTYELIGPERFPAIDDFGFTYRPVVGLKPADPLSAEDLNRLHLLKRKLEVLVQVKSILELARQDIRESFEEEVLQAFPIEPRNFRLFWEFMRFERELLFTKADQFFNEFSGRVKTAADIPAVEKIYNHLVENVNIGVYSATNRERKKIGVGKSQL